jgi:hypothetical protein
MLNVKSLSKTVTVQAIIFTFSSSVPIFGCFIFDRIQYLLFSHVRHSFFSQVRRWFILVSYFRDWILLDFRCCFGKENVEHRSQEKESKTDSKIPKHVAGRVNFS